MTDAQRALYVHNLKLAREFIKDVEPRRLWLETWCDPHGCETLYCTAGWLTTHPFFGQFMKLDRNMLAPTFVPGWERIYLESMAHNYRWLDALFGPDAFDYIFSGRTCSPFDDEIMGDDDSTLTDHELAMSRIELAIERIEHLPATA